MTVIGGSFCPYNVARVAEPPENGDYAPSSVGATFAEVNNRKPSEPLRGDMSVPSQSVGSTPDRGEVEYSLVDPRAPRFGQTLTTLGLAGAVILVLPTLLYVTAVVLMAAVASGWRLDLYAVLWRRAVLPVVGPPVEREPAAPHRFARVLGAAGAGLASLFVLAGVSTVGYAVAGFVALLAGLAAASGLCLGCRLYRQVALFRRFDVV